MARSIDHMGGGWHRQTINAHAAASGTSEAVEITWRKQRVRCCGRNLEIAGPDRAPVWIDGSHGEVHGDVTQCPSCGAQHTARFTIA